LDLERLDVILMDILEKMEKLQNFGLQDVIEKSRHGVDI